MDFLLDLTKNSKDLLPSLYEARQCHRGSPLRALGQPRGRGKELWNPTSREKRARYGAPVLGYGAEMEVVSVVFFSILLN
jgi:hypothetical protein